MPYTTTLADADLDFGRQVIDGLKAQGFPFTGAFWLYDEDADNWQFVIATGLVDQEGRQPTYRQLVPLISKVPKSDLRVLNITVMSPQTPLYTALKKSFGHGDPVEGVRLQHHVVSGVLIPAAYLYEIQ